MPAKKSTSPAEPVEPVLPPPPPLPSAPPAPPTPYIPPQPLSPGDERTWAMIAHLSVLINLVSGIFGPVAALIIYMVYKDRSRYVAYHSMQSLIFQLIWWYGGGALVGAAWAVSGALSAVLIGLLCMPIACLISFIPLGALIYGIVGAVQTSQGQDFKYWLIGDWVRGTLTGA
ncbi:MAG: DUF4870 domain-containing protein [Anaerolineales bacterium]|nr:DUF4870 domain-containing protein [Anaerolineales bacterium]